MHRFAATQIAPGMNRAFSAGSLAIARIPGALPQAACDCRAFGAKQIPKYNPPRRAGFGNERDREGRTRDERGRRIGAKHEPKLSTPPKTWPFTRPTASRFKTVPLLPFQSNSQKPGTALIFAVLIIQP